MSGINRYFQSRGVLSFALQQPVLDYVSFVHISHGDNTAQFSKAATELLSLPNVQQIEFLKNDLGDYQYLNIRQNNKEQITDSDIKKIHAIIERHISNGSLIDEEGLLKWSEALKDPDRDLSMLEENVAEKTIDEFVPYMHGRTGHDVGINFHGFSKPADGTRGVIASVTMQQGCKTCGTFTSRNTLGIYSTWLQANLTKAFEGMAAEKRPVLRTINILPDRNGSPSYSYVPS